MESLSDEVDRGDFFNGKDADTFTRLAKSVKHGTIF